MIEYKFTRDYESKNIYITSDSILPGSIPVNIPSSDKRKKQYISLFLHKEDIDEAIRFLEYVVDITNKFDIKQYIINQALFLSSLTNFIKCFQTSNACSVISETKFLMHYPEHEQNFKKFKNWRNNYFMHDSNRMREGIAFLIVAPEESGQILGGAPSVVWNKVNINYYHESQILKQLLYSLRDFICSEIDKKGNSIIIDYQSKSREELLSYGEVVLKPASSDNPESTREIL